jgi:hypothetical protein
MNNRSVSKTVSVLGSLIAFTNIQRRNYLCGTECPWNLWNDTEILTSKKGILYVAYIDETVRLLINRTQLSLPSRAAWLTAKRCKIFPIRVKYRSIKTSRSTYLYYKKCLKVCPCTRVHTLGAIQIGLNFCRMCLTYPLFRLVFLWWQCRCFRQMFCSEVIQ